MQQMVWGSDPSIYRKNQFLNALEKNSDDSSESDVEKIGNHIYFYNDIYDHTILKLNKAIREVGKAIKTSLQPFDLNTKPQIHIHVNSQGGSVMAGIAGMENILAAKKEFEIVTHVEGMVASAATYLTIVGDKRIIHPHSYMLIHQISAFYHGNYEQLKDRKENLDELMNFCKKIYFEYTNVPEEKIEEILKHDLYFNAETCKEYGLVDEVSE